MLIIRSYPLSATTSHRADTREECRRSTRFCTDASGRERRGESGNTLRTWTDTCFIGIWRTRKITIWRAASSIPETKGLLLRKMVRLQHSFMMVLYHLQCAFEACLHFLLNSGINSCMYSLCRCIFGIRLCCYFYTLVCVIHLGRKPSKKHSWATELVKKLVTLGIACCFMKPPATVVGVNTAS